MTSGPLFDATSTVEQNLRAMCQASCERHPDLPRIKTIASVGAFDNRIGHTSRDASRLTHTLLYLLKSGFIIDPDFTVDAVNFKDNRDFLREDHQADLVFVSYIIRNPASFTSTFRKVAEGEKPLETKDLVCTLSQHHDAREWAHRARIGGAKMIVGYGGITEIGAEYFCDPSTSEAPFQLLIASPKEECAGSFQISEMKRIYGRKIDLPVAGLSFCADQHYLHAVAPAMSGQTHLSKLACDIPDLGLQSAPHPQTAPSRYEAIKLR